ncbi:hypothetical protein C2R78_02695 [Helicobacter pylori]|nr:hypothetical protein C2R78_02695 [Helicobacter pylori]
MSSNAFPTGLTHHISKGVTLHTSCARYECMGILYHHELVAFIPTAKDDWDFCLGNLKDNYTSTQEKENIMDKLEQIDSIKPFNERLKGILENAKENLQAQSCVKGRGR